MRLTPAWPVGKMNVVNKEQTMGIMDDLPKNAAKAADKMVADQKAKLEEQKEKHEQQATDDSASS